MGTVTGAEVAVVKVVAATEQEMVMVEGGMVVVGSEEAVLEVAEWAAAEKAAAALAAAALAAAAMAAAATAAAEDPARRLCCRRWQTECYGPCRQDRRHR